MEREGLFVEELTPIGRAARTRAWGATLAAEDFVALPGSVLTGWLSPEAVVRLAAFWERLDIDRQVAGGVYRRRRYGRLMASRGETGEWSFTLLPHVAFQQSAEHIPLYAGKARMFSPILAETLTDPVLTKLVAIDLDIVSTVGEAAEAGASRFEAGLHLIRVISAAGAPGLPTPEGRHSDGHDFIGMHLLGRSNCSGGESVVYRKDRSPTRIELSEPLDSLVVSDTRITHEVTPMITDGATGVRDMLLVDINAR